MNQTKQIIVLTWKRFRDVSKTTKAALAANTEASSRAQRTRRRLYQMALSIIVPYVPLQMVFFVLNMKVTFLTLHPYDYYIIHFVPNPYPWSSIIMMPSYMLDFASMNQPWVPILTIIPIVLFFGMTKEAIDVYRKFLVRLGLAKCFPSLKEPYDPDRPRSTDASQKCWWNSSKNRKPAVNET
jgi:pheromone a factor receptor